MKKLIKHWNSSVLKVKTPKCKRTTSAKDCIDLKIRMTEEQLKTSFSKESKLLLAEFQKPDCMHSLNCTSHVCDVTNRHLDVLFANCFKYYIHLCALNYLSAIIPFQTTRSANKAFAKYPLNVETLEKIKDDTVECILFFYETRDNLKKNLSNKLRNEGKTILQVEKYIRNVWQKLANYSYQLQVKGTLIYISLSGRSQYVYNCEMSDSSCNVCTNLDGQVFNVSDAKTGENLPPMHPNCRCTISAYPPLTELPQTPEILQDTPVEYVRDIIEYALQQVESKVDDLAENFGDIWEFIFRASLEDVYGTYTTTIINGVAYRINIASFESVVIMPDGTYLVPAVVSDADRQMLALMKERDSLLEGDPRIDELNSELKTIYESTDESERHVYWKKPYSFYNFGGDVTERLNEYMQKMSATYADMHNRYWAENLSDFYNLVRNRGEMDLKNQPEWQNSAYIYDGEIVSQDALGNINYGYFGKHCNFPDSVLIAAGGVAQFLAGTSEWDNWYVFLDDPRDTYRVMQGIEIYEESTQP